MRLMLILKLLVPIVVLGFSTIAPAFAGSKEAALLASYAGEWRGKGKVTGPDPGTVVCRISFKAISQTLAYSGRCSFGVGQTTFRGAVSYNEGKGRFEAASQAQGITTVAIGSQSGNTINFSTSGMETKQGKASSSMTFAGKSIKLSFKLVDKKGAVTASSITFSKS